MTFGAKIVQWVKNNRVILSNAASLVGTTGATSVLGFVYWWIAARQFSPAAVGLASAAISATTLLGTIGMLGLGTLLMGELSRHPDKKGALLVTALAAAGIAGLVLGLGFAVFAPLGSAEFGPLAENFGTIALFSVGVTFTALTLVLDQALIGLLLGVLQFWRNVLFALVKLIILVGFGFWLTDKTGLSIFATWQVGTLTSLLALLGYATWKKKLRKEVLRPQLSLLRQISRAALGHHLLNLALLIPILLLPVLVTVLLSATTNAHFYVAWMIANFIFIGPASLSMVLYAVGAADSALLARKLRFTLKIALVLAVLAQIALLPSAGLILSFFGRVYVEQSQLSLHIVALAVFPLIIKDHYVAICRIKGHMQSGIIWVSLGCLLELGGATLGAILTASLPGLALGWVLGLCLEAAFMVYKVYRTARNPQGEQSEEGRWSLNNSESVATEQIAS